MNDQKVLEAVDEKRRPLAELEAEHDALKRQLQAGYEHEVEIRRERALSEWDERRTRDLAMLDKATVNLTWAIIKGGSVDTAEVERLRVITAQPLDIVTREQIASMPGAEFVPIDSHRRAERAHLQKLKRQIEDRRGESLLKPTQIRAVRAGTMSVGKEAIKRAGAKSLKELIEMSEAHHRRQRGLS